MKKALKWTIYLLLLSLVFIGAMTCWYFVITADTEFDDSKLKKFEQSYVVYNSDNEIMKTKRNIEYVTIDKLPDHVKSAFISVEDKRFYSHSGIDKRAILRAIKNNIFSFSFKEGASTISQQLVKNTFLTGEKTVARKMNEIKLTKILEKKYSKDEILEMYLNTVYFGEGAYGIESASKKYFGVKAEELDVLEAATLAGLIKSPSKYDPFKNYELSKNRRNIVLGLMEECGYKFTSDIKHLKNKDIILNYSNSESNTDKTLQVIEDEALELLNKDNLEELNGYKIYTSLNSNLMNEIAVPEDYGIDTDYSIIVIDNKTQSIISSKATVGEEKRCPASSAKPWLVYAPAIEEKYITEATKIDDSPTDFNGYSPTNYGDKYYGFICAKDCLSKSLNVPAVKIVSGLGIDKISKYAEKMGIEVQGDLSVALGNISGGISLRTLAGAYLPFSTGGYYSTPAFIEKIVDPKGKTVYSKPKKQVKIFSEGTAFLISDMLYETVKSGTARKLSALNFDVCAKTGTNGNENGNTDAYCVAYTPDYTVAVWLGNRDFSVMDNSISGGTYPTAIAADVLSSLYKNNKPQRFSCPQDVVLAEIDKKSYEDGKIYLSDGDKKDKIAFYFLKGTEPNQKVKREKIPKILNYGIECNENIVKIFVETDNETFYRIYSGNELLFDSKTENGDFIYDNLTENSEYEFYILPYSIDNNDEILGTKIKLPAIKTGGNHHRRIIDSPWWEYD